MTRNRLHLALPLGVALAAALGAGNVGGQAAADVRSDQVAQHAAPAGGPVLSAKARAQLAEARRGTAALSTPAAAVAAGYRPVFGDVPLQGEHYARTDLVAGGRFDPARPSVLMFAPVNGRETLVGAAYAYMHPLGAPLPEGFDGTADKWHDHADLVSSPGRQLVMVHAWFVDAPDGPFARHNPNLPYLAVGLVPPAASVFADHASAAGALALGRALALAAEPPPAVLAVEERGGEAVRREAAARRRQIEALVPRLRAAQRSGDRAAYGRLSAEAVKHGDAMIAAYRTAAADRPGMLRLLEQAMGEFMGHGHEGGHAGHGS